MRHITDKEHRFERALRVFFIKVLQDIHDKAIQFTIEHMINVYICLG